MEIGPVAGNFPGMLQKRGYEIRLPADWPPDTVTVNGTPVPQSQNGREGWSFEGNTLTTVIPVPSGAVSSRTVIEVRRAMGLTARRAELDGFAGSKMSRLKRAHSMQ